MSVYHSNGGYQSNRLKEASDPIPVIISGIIVVLFNLYVVLRYGLTRDTMWFVVFWAGLIALGAAVSGLIKVSESRGHPMLARLNIGDGAELMIRGGVVSASGLGRSSHHDGMHDWVEYTSIIERWELEGYVRRGEELHKLGTKQAVCSNGKPDVEAQVKTGWPFLEQANQILRSDRPNH